MSKTVAIYQQKPDGMLRVGTFTVRKFYSVRAISEQFFAKQPNMRSGGKVYFCRRMMIGGRYVDDNGNLIPLDDDRD